MRQLFLPVCVCLVTWSGATSIADLKLLFNEFSGSMAVEQKIHAPIAGTDVGEAAANKTATSMGPEVSTAPHVDSTPQDVAMLAGDLAIEQPVPSGVVVNNGIPTGIPLPPIAKPVIARTTEEICDTLAYAAQSNDLPAPFFIRLLFQESRFKPGIVSSAGAQGVAQFMPETAADMGLENPFDPLQAIPASARLLRNLNQQFGNLGLAAAAYNAGPKRIADWLANRRNNNKNKLPEETQGYVKIITGHAAESWKEASARHPGEKLPRHAPCQEAAGLLAWNGPDAVPLPAAAPLKVAAIAAAAEKRKAEKSKAVASKSKAADKPKEKPKAATQLAEHKPKHKTEHKPERIAQR
jgi:hypothetical protein